MLTTGCEVSLRVGSDQTDCEAEPATFFLRIIKVLLVGIAASLAGCANDGRYHVLLVVDAKNYSAEMTWDQIRENTFKMPYAIRVSDVKGSPVQLFRFSHDDGGIMPLDATETKIHISTPIIIEKKNAVIGLSVYGRGEDKPEIEMQVVIQGLKPVKDRPEASVVLINLPSGK